MNTIIRAASRIAARPILERTRLVVKPSAAVSKFQMTINKRWAHNQHLTFDFVRERILLVLRLFDKVDPEKLTLDSHFVNDLGLDSLDHVEIIMQLESEFKFDIPDKDAEKLITPRHMLMYITDHEEAYEELQKLQAHGHHDEHHELPEHHELYGLKVPHIQKHDFGAGPKADHSSSTSHDHQQKRSFSTFATMSRRFMSNDNSGTKKEYPTTFGSKPPKEVKIEDIQARVMKVCSKYDKIDSSKLDLASHFVQDLGLDSLDHVEIMMELEDEFGLEIPDQEAEKLMRPAEIARFVFKLEEKRALEVEDRPF